MRIRLSKERLLGATPCNTYNRKQDQIINQSIYVYKENSYYKWINIDENP